MTELQNKVALVTGASKGIGYGIAEELLKQNVKVAITSRSKSAADQAADQLRKSGKEEVLAFESDVRDYASLDKISKEIADYWGGIDVVVANAGVGHFGSIEELSMEQWQETIDTNLTGVFNTTKAVIPALKKSKGYLITMASLAGTNFFPGGSAYNASKFGLVGFSQAIMLDLRQYGIKVTTIMPGSVATKFIDQEAADDSWKIHPEDLGQMVIDLLKMHPRTLPSKIEVRPTTPPKK